MKWLVLVLAFFSASVFSQKNEKEGVEVQKSRLLLLPASTVERSAGQQYGQLMRAAAQKGLLNNDPQQVERLRRIARELVPHAARFNKNAEKWRWEVNLITSKTVNAFCMPGGKIAFFTGILDALQLTDDEVATIMGHEIGHALLEHGRRGRRVAEDGAPFASERAVRRPRPAAAIPVDPPVARIAHPRNRGQPAQSAAALPEGESVSSAGGGPIIAAQFHIHLRSSR
jgi:predicted Zn-dependent protease